MALLEPNIVDQLPPYTVVPATSPGCLVFASPHSGSHYPEDMNSAPLTEASLRSAEDALIDRLIAPGRGHGATLVLARYGRAYLDLNRDPEDLDPQLIEDAEGLAASPRAVAGYGIAPRLTGDGQPLYQRVLTRAEIASRIDRVHRPYHAALAELMRAARERCGAALLIDWHSMPAKATAGARGAQIVLGDRHGSSCSAGLTRRLRDLFESHGLRVALNQPYAGGYSTQLWGRPAENFHALQVEISRSLYLDQTRLEPNLSWPRLEKALDQIIARLGLEVGDLIGAR